MEIIETLSAREIVITLGEHDAPATAKKKSVRFLRDADGADVAPPQIVEQEISFEDVELSLNGALLDERNALNSRVAELSDEKAALLAERAG